jgi:hypothetical protein
VKALSIQNPWAWAICAGHKDVENRDWATRHRGPLLIHAGKTVDADSLAFVESTAGCAASPAASMGPGALIGAAVLVDLVERHDSPWFFGRYGLILAHPILFARPIPCRGLPSVFEPALSAEAEARLRHELLAAGWPPAGEGA